MFHCYYCDLKKKQQQCTISLKYILNGLSACLSNRQQKRGIGGETSSNKGISTRVPQELVLGLNLFRNDMEINISAPVNLYLYIMHRLTE